MFYNVMSVQRRMVSAMAILLVLNVSAGAQQGKKITLRIGDKVPELKYGSWVKGTPVKEYEKGRLYFFEFWATWCGPCIASMPHLSEFARQHKDDATVIAVDIWENAHSEEKKSVSSFLPKVTRFVNNMGSKMDFNVITDTEDEFMGNQWMKAAGQEGIPCSFMVKDGVILWVGHPVQLDSIVSLVMSGNYDVQAARKAAIEKESRVDPNMAAFKTIFNSYEALTKEKQYKKAVHVLDSGMAALPTMAGTLGFFKFQTMLEHLDEKSALAFAKEWQKSKPGYVGSAATVIAQKKGLSKTTYQYALELLKQQLAVPQMPSSAVYSQMAALYANMSDYKNAVIYQSKAVADGKQFIKEGKFAGFVTGDSVQADEKKLTEYKNKLK